MGYYRVTARKQQELQYLRDELGSWEAVARHINKGSRSGTVSRKQVAKLARGERIRVSEATSQRIRRGSRMSYPRTRTRVRVAQLTRDKKDSATRNIANKIARLERRAEQYEAVGAINEAEATRDEISRLNDFRDDIQEAARSVETYDEYRDLADRNTP